MDDEFVYQRQLLDELCLILSFKLSKKIRYFNNSSDFYIDNNKYVYIIVNDVKIHRNWNLYDLKSNGVEVGDNTFNALIERSIEAIEL